MSPQDEQIARLGFEAWADNVIVNFIEDNKDMMKLGDGNLSMENDARLVRAEWKGNEVNILVRAYTKNGWQTHERSVWL